MMTSKEEILEILGHRELTESEKVLVEEWLSVDKVFTASYNFQLQLNAAIHHTERSELKTMLQQVEAENQNTKVPIYKLATFRIIAVAASVFVLLGLWLFNNGNQNKNLYAENFRPYPNVVAPFTRNGTIYDTLTLAAFTAYEQANYADAATLFNQMHLQTNEQYPVFYQAICLMELEQIPEALRIFTTNQWPETPFNMKQEAEWYAALCQWKMGNRKEAKKSFTSISNQPEHSRQELASAVLKDF